MEKLNGCFFVEDDELLKIYNGIWIDSAIVLKKILNVNPSEVKHFLKPKKSNTVISLDNEIPKVGSNYTCLEVILINLVLKKDENYYLQVFLKECKYI